MNQRLTLGRTVLARLNRGTARNRRYWTTTSTWKRTGMAGVGLVGLGVAIPLTMYYVVNGRPQGAVYPAAIERQLRGALMAEHGREDTGTAERAMGEAYEAAKPLMAAGSLRWFDGAAIALRWAHLCEQTGQLQAALRVYDLLLADLRAVWPRLAPDERLRTIQVAQKLAARLTQSHLPTPPPPETLKKIEDCLSFSVQEILRFLPPQDHTLVSSREAPGLPDSCDPSELSLQFASCFEALAKFYHERGQASYAMPLYLQTLSLLLPDGARSTRATDTARCRAATVMNNIGQLVVSGGGGEERLANGAKWLTQASGLAGGVLASANPHSNTPHLALVPPVGPLAECHAALHAANHNLNALHLSPSPAPPAQLASPSAPHPRSPEPRT